MGQRCRSLNLPPWFLILVCCAPLILTKVAAPLAELLRAHDQALDPNLVLLAEAWSEAVAKAGGEKALEARLGGAKGEKIPSSLYC